MEKLVECVPNISEGNDLEIIDKIVETVDKYPGVKLLNVDPGKATNRTVITFVGDANVIVDAAFTLIAKAKELIDMRFHSGEHPRMGAVDVCPLIPISGITMDETVKLAHNLSKRVGNELSIPVYCYEYAAKEEKRKNLANCRSGEYEGIENKFNDKSWKPDYGPYKLNEEVMKSGATAISARDFLVAYNVNLNTTSTRRANSVAFDLREAGRLKRVGGKITGKIIKDKNDDPVRTPGYFKNLKGIGWFIDEYGVAQISYNITNINTTPLHEVFDKTCERAQARGMRVTGSELIGLVPKKVLLDAGRYYLAKQNRSKAIPENEIIHIAVKSLGLDELNPFDPEKRVIEYMIDDKNKELSKKTIKEFANITSSESPAPGGGSISAYCGALGVSLAVMVANLSAHKRGWDDKWEYYSNSGEKGMFLQSQLLDLVDEDTDAFNSIMNAFSLPKDTDDEKVIRNNQIQRATKNAIEVPFKIMSICYDSLDIILEMAQNGNPNSITDVGVAMHCAKAAIHGAFLNVRINCNDLKDKSFVKKILSNGTKILNQTYSKEKLILGIVDKKLS
jgi:glutamate formiminotransferase/formiminotetrahydrofolate cyclodeaminase